MNDIRVNYRTREDDIRWTLEQWEKSEMFCPACGVKAVWIELTYSCGECPSRECCCLSCGREFGITDPHPIDLRKTDENSRFLSLLIADLPKEKENT